MRARVREGDQRRAAFLAGLERGLSAAGAAAAAGVHRSLAYKWRMMSRDFEAAWRLAEQAGADVLEDEALRRALEGSEKPVFYRGQQVGTVRTYNDRLLMLLLQRRRPAAKPDEGELRHSQLKSDAFVQELVDALGACDRRIAELTQEVAALRRSQAGAAADDVAEPVPVVLPYDEVALFGEIEDDEEDEFEAPQAAGTKSGTGAGAAPDGTCDAAPAAPESPVLPVSNCLPASAAPADGTCAAAPVAPASETESPLLPVSNCLLAGASPSGSPDSATPRSDLRGLLAESLQA
jgi:hypothetical protein